MFQGVEIIYYVLIGGSHIERTKAVYSQIELMRWRQALHFFGCPISTISQITVVEEP